MKKHLFIKLSLLLLLVICNTHAWGKYLYLNTANLPGWEGTDATFKLYPGTGSDVTGVKVYDHMYRFDVPKATGTMYFKRCNSTGATLWNQFPVDYNASYNVYKVTSWDRDGCSSQCSSGTYDNSITMKEIYLDVHTKWYQDGPLFKLTTGGTTYTAVGFAGTNLVLFSVPSPSGNLYFERWKSDNSTRWNTAETTYNSSYNAYEITDWGVVSGSYNVKIVDKPNYIYFDNSQIAFGTSNAYVVVGHDKPTAYSSTYAFRTKPITNTKLYYYNNTGNTWRDATYYAFLQNSSSFGGGSWGSSNLSTASKYTAAYTTATDLSWDKMYLFVPASGSNGASLTLNTYSAASDMNSTQTIKYAISIDNGSSYTELTSGKTPAQLQISAYKFNNGTYNSVSNSSNSQTLSANSTTYSASVPAGYTGKTTLSCGSVQTGYTFVDWADAPNGSTVTSPYYPTGEKTVYARLKATQVTVTLNKNYGTGGTASVKATYGVGTLPSITNPTRSGYEFAGWFTGSGGTGKLVIDIDGSLQPGISGFTDADGKWIATSNQNVYAGWLTVHSPGVYTSTYGQPLTISSCEAYEVYRYAVSSSTIYVNAGGESAPVTTTDARRLFSFSQTTTDGACSYTWNGWIGHTETYGKETGTAVASGEFKAHSVGQPSCRNQQGFIICVTGYSQFSIYAADNNNTGDKHFKVFINGVDVTKDLSKGFTVRRYDLTPANTYIIRVTGQTNNNNQIQGFSLKLPAYPTPTSLAASDITSSGVTLTVTDDLSTGDYDFYVSKSSTKPAVDATPTESTDDETSVDITGLDAATNYYAWVRSKCSNTRKSDWVALTGSYFTTSAAGCSATTPGTISKGTLSGCSITLTASGSAASNNTWYWQASADGTSTSESGATKDVTAPGTYYIRSFYSTGSCWSDAESYTVTASDLTPAAPTALAAASPTAKGVTLTVTDAANTNDYEFYVSTNSSTPSSGTTATHSVTSAKSLTITNLYAGTKFYAWARAKCGSNKSAWTALTDDSFTTSKVTMTPTLTNVTHNSGATSSIGGSDYTAEFTASTGYSMPNPTVTIGGNAATIVTDYTWSVEGAVGTITIPANKINGNIVITLNSAPSAPSSATISGTYHYFPGENISLTCTPSGNNGPTTYQWYKGGKADGNMIDGATSATYTKNSCTFDDAGSYFCKVTCNATSIWAKSGSSYDVTILRLYVKDSKGGAPYGNVDFVKVSSTTATASISLGSGTTYGFNIADGCGHYYGNSGTMQYNSYGPWVTNQDGTDCGLTTTNAGTYIFTIDYSTWAQITTTVTFPSCTDPGLAFAADSKTTTLCDDAPTNALTNTHGVTVSYASSDETVATVASDGTLTIKKAGTTTITASSLEQTVSAVDYCADEASYTLTVSASTAAGLAYGTSTIKKDVGDDAFTNTLTNSNSLTGITYTSSNTAVATVDEDGEVTIKAAGTTTITASSDQQKITSTCYAAGEVSYTLTVYPVYTVTYNAMGGTCSPTSTNTTTALGKVTLPSATHAIYTTYTWVTSDGTEAGDAGDTYTPEGNINLYAKWSGSCAGGGSTTVVIFDGSTMSSKTSASGTSYERDTEHTHAGTGLKYTLKGVKDGLVSASLTGGSPSKTYTNSIQNGGGGSASYHIELKVPTGKTATVYVAYWTGSTNHYIGLNASSAISPTGSNCTWNPDKAASTNTIYYGTTSSLSAGTYYLVGDADAIRFAEVKVTVTGSTCYTVTYDGNGADGGYTNDPAQYAKDADPEVLDCGYTRTGYDFIGWADGTDHRDDGTVDYQPGDIIRDISSDVTLYAIWKQIKYFTGAASTTSWNTDGNWSPSGVPAITDPVVIQANVTVDINNAKALRVDIETGKTLTINAGMALIIAETLTKNGGATEAADVIINSTRDAGVGALIIGSEAGDNAATMNFETKAKLVGGSTVNQFIGSPFSNAAPYVDYGQQLYKFCPKQNGDRGWWQSHTSLATMTPFWGYNVLCTETSFLDLNWTGKLNPSESKTITDFYYNGSSETDNMFANSWTAPIHVGAFEDGDFVNASTTLYMFNAGTPAQEAGHSDDDATNGSTEPGTYISIPIHSAPYAGIGVIPSMQAFYVLSTGSDASITLDYNKIVYTPALTSVGIVPNRAPKHNAEVVEPEVIKLHVQSETGWAANTYVMGRADFAEGYEDGWDGAYIEGESATPKLYTPSIDGNMFINCLPEIEGTVVGFRKGSSDNNYIFSFDYDGDEVWYLNDQKAQKSTQIMNGQTYAFVSEAGDNAARFVISATPINKIATGCESVGAEAAKVRKLIINDKVYIIRGGQVFDVLGKTIKK